MRWLFVVFGIVLLTSLGIDATQYMEGSQSALGILAGALTAPSCPSGMTQVASVHGDYCIDAYEASVGSECGHKAPQHTGQTAGNLNQPKCTPESKKDVQPWTHVTYEQAAALCARAGKRLPNNIEWYQASLGTPDPVSGEYCALKETSVQKTGSTNACVSGMEAYDMVGNVWEWVDASDYTPAELPESGYVRSVDAAGVAKITDVQAEETFNDDYFWSTSESVGMMRGGFYGSGSDAGIYSVHADLVSGFSGEAVGFRCVLDLGT